MSDFKVGDTVILNSGSPLMTIQEVYNDDTVLKCDYWFEGDFKTFTGLVSQVTKINKEALELLQSKPYVDFKVG